MENEKFFELAVKSISGEASAEEKEELNQYLKEDKYASKYQLLETNWHYLKFPVDYTQFNLHYGLQKLHNKISEQNVPAYTALWRRNLGKIIHPNYLLKLAVSIAILVIIYISASYIDSYFNKKESKFILNEKVTQLGQKSIITLLDGTTITLNANSKLRFPANFNSKMREVYLEGEAYFEVAHDSTSPFIVHTGNFRVTVLGTVFDVKDFPDENNYSVSLVKGKVKVTKDKAKRKSYNVILQPNQQFSYNKITGVDKIKNFDYQEVAGWKKNILVFNNTPLKEVFVQLGREYGLNFKLNDKSLSDIKINANFKNEPFWIIVNVIQSATDLAFKTVSNERNELKEIIFFKK